jgi:hypothetical protein
LVEKKEKLFEFNVPCPKYKEQVVSLNNFSKWYRFKGSTIKNTYIELLHEWCIPEPEETLDEILVEYHLYRHNKRVLDADNLGFIIKWTNDAIKNKKNELKNLTFLTDDDQVHYYVKPAVLNRELLETEIKVKVYRI